MCKEDWRKRKTISKQIIFFSFFFYFYLFDEFKIEEKNIQHIYRVMTHIEEKHWNYCG